MPPLFLWLGPIALAALQVLSVLCAFLAFSKIFTVTVYDYIYHWFHLVTLDMTLKALLVMNV